jgi:hypothetical protein
LVQQGPEMERNMRLIGMLIQTGLNYYFYCTAIQD